MAGGSPANPATLDNDGLLLWSRRPSTAFRAAGAGGSPGGAGWLQERLLRPSWKRPVAGAEPRPVRQGPAFRRSGRPMSLPVGAGAGVWRLHSTAQASPAWQAPQP